MAGLVLAPVAWAVWVLTRGLRDAMPTAAYAVLVGLVLLVLHYGLVMPKTEAGSTIASVAAAMAAWARPASG